MSKAKEYIDRHKTWNEELGNCVLWMDAERAVDISVEETKQKAIKALCDNCCNHDECKYSCNFKKRFVELLNQE